MARLTGLYVSLAIVLSAAAQEGKEGDRIRVRFLDKHEEVVTVVSWKETGMTLKLDDVTPPVFFEWWRFDPDSAEMLRKRYLGTPKPVEEAVTLPGVRVTTKDDRVFTGILDPRSPPAELWIKNSSRTEPWVVKQSDVKSREEIRIKIGEAYNAEEIYRILVERLHPREAEEYMKLAEELVRVGLPDRAVEAIQIAEVLRRPELPESRLYKDLLKLRDQIQDITLLKAIYNIQEGYLAGKYETALEQVDFVEKQVKDESLRLELRRIRTELQQLRDMSRDEKIIAEWCRLLDTLIRAKAFDTKISFVEAADFVEKDLASEVLKRVNERFNIGKNDNSAKIIWEGRSTSGLLKHNYDETSWLVERPEARAAQAWWDQANNVQRFQILKGLAIEKHLKVLRMDRKNCGTCGATGRVERAKYPEAAGGVCPSCLGLKQHRVLFYR